MVRQVGISLCTTIESPAAVAGMQLMVAAFLEVLITSLGTGIERSGAALMNPMDPEHNPGSVRCPSRAVRLSPGHQFGSGAVSAALPKPPVIA